MSLMQTRSAVRKFNANTGTGKTSIFNVQNPRKHKSAAVCLHGTYPDRNQAFLIRSWQQMSPHEQHLCLAASLATQNGGALVSIGAPFMQMQGTATAESFADRGDLPASTLFDKSVWDETQVVESLTYVWEAFQPDMDSGDLVRLIVDWVRLPPIECLEVKHETFVCSLNLYSWYVFWEMAKMPPHFFDHDVASVFGKRADDDAVNEVGRRLGTRRTTNRALMERIALEFYKARMLGKAWLKEETLVTDVNNTLVRSPFITRTHVIGNNKADTVRAFAPSDTAHQEHGLTIGENEAPSEALYEYLAGKAGDAHEAMMAKSPDKLASDDDWMWWKSMCSFLHLETGVADNTLPRSFLKKQVVFML